LAFNKRGGEGTGGKGLRWKVRRIEPPHTPRSILLRGEREKKRIRKKKKKGKEGKGKNEKKIPLEAH